MNRILNIASIVFAATSILGLAMMYIHVFDTPPVGMRDQMVMVSNTMMIGGAIAYAIVLILKHRRNPNAVI